MALHLQLQTQPFGAFATIDLAQIKACNFRLTLGYSHPSLLSFDLHAPQQSYPLGIRNFVRFWDDTVNAATGQPWFSADVPLFEGLVEEVRPGVEANIVHLTCYDPTRKVAHELTLMSLAFQQGSISAGTPPVEGTGAIPRAVYNSLIDNDDDYAYERLHFGSVGQILADLFDMVYQALYWSNAAPGDGSDAGNAAAYLQSDLDALAFVPQEKMVFESEGLRSAIDRMLHLWLPSWRLHWWAGVRLWRLGDLLACPARTLTLNDFRDTNPYHVLSLELDRSLEGRATAIKIYGPPTLAQLSPTVSGGGLTILDNGITLESGIGGNPGVTGHNTFQIADPSLRNISRLLLTPIDAQYSDRYYQTTRSATFFGYWAASSAGDAGWRAIDSVVLDAKHGILSFNGDLAVYRYNPNPAAGQPHYEVPTDYMFTYATFAETLSVRYPASGFAGTAFDVANLQNEFKLYDEMLAVGYEYNNPVTTSARLAQFTSLAQSMHAQRKDIVYIGGCVLEGLTYDFARINARVNLAGVDGNGQALATGWENIGALVTDVEFDFESQQTTLTFSSDQLELCGINVDQLKQRLQIRALQRVDYTHVSFGTTFRERSISDSVSGFDQFGKVQETTYQVDQGHVYVDPVSGRVDTGDQVMGPSAAASWDQNGRLRDAAQDVAGYLPAGSMVTDGQHHQGQGA